jgi:hypothetical protein
MFTGKSPDAFAKHLPEAARHALIRKSDGDQTSYVTKFAAASRELSAPGRMLQTFDVGPLLLSFENRGGLDKFEITVERDNLMGDEDEIELSLQTFEKGEVQTLPLLPRLIFTMKQENDIWRVNEATLAVHAPLADPDYLATLKKMQNEEDEQSARIRLGDLVGVEKRYADMHPEIGYSCKLSDLYPSDKKNNDDDGEQNGEFANPDLAKNESYGFHFAISGCKGAPATNFHATAVPVESGSGMKAFCVDSSDKMRFAPDGTAASCLSSGEIVNQEEGIKD